MKTLDMHITDIIHNSIRGGASFIKIELIDSDIDNIISISISDNGCGIDKETLEAINKSFFSSRKERKTGMGLALLKFNANLTGGKFLIDSTPGQGTFVKATFGKNHIDRQPLGNVAECIASFVCQYQQINFVFKYKNDLDEFSIDSNSVKEVFEGFEINSASVIKSLTEFITQSIA
ncbi:MAG: ATP-binding protein [Bacteroidales bacterium]|nr:ATP-binding protein [Bacteroidales bacterium]MDD4216087.1 ATP-binding protein [Bacteroidales bacterium]MDY0141195.1 ATP-binding protein [Bacteroidales bacterium]